MPLPNDIRRTLNAWPRSSITALYTRINKKLLRDLKETKLYKTRHGRKRAIDVAFDKTEVLFYGKDRNLTTYSRGRGSARRCFIFLTLQIVCPGLRMVLGAQPVFSDTNIGKMMAKMLKRARRQGIRIRKVYLDRGFYAVDALEELKATMPAQDFIMPAVRHSGIKKIMQTWY